MLGFGGGDEAVKVLRIGIVKDGKVVHERLIKPGQNVTVGESPRNTFVIPGADLEFGVCALSFGHYTGGVSADGSSVLAVVFRSVPARPVPTRVGLTPKPSFQTS